MVPTRPAGHGVRPGRLRGVGRRWAAIGLCLFFVGLAGCGTGERSQGDGRSSTTLEPERPTTTVPQIEYTVQSRDTLSRIASRFNTTVDALRQANSLSTDVLRPGQKLRIPSETGTQPTRPADQGEPPITTTTPVPTPTSGADDGRSTALLVGGLLVATALVVGISVLYVRLRRRRRGESVRPSETSSHVDGSRVMGNLPSPMAPLRETVIAAPDSEPVRASARVRETAVAEAVKPARVTPAPPVRTAPPVVRPTSPPAKSGDPAFQARVIGLAPMADHSTNGDYAGLLSPDDLRAVRPCPACGAVQSVAEIGCACVNCGERLSGGSTYPWPVVLVPKG